MDLNVVQWVHVAGMIGANGFLGPSTEEQLSWAVPDFTVHNHSDAQNRSAFSG